MGDERTVSAFSHAADWGTFQRAGLLWWVNRQLHLFGYAVVFEVQGDGSIIDVYPACVPFRGFSSDDEGEGFERLTRYVKEKAGLLLSEVLEGPGEAAAERSRVDEGTDVRLGRSRESGREVERLEVIRWLRSEARKAEGALGGSDEVVVLEAAARAIELAHHVGISHEGPRPNFFSGPEAVSVRDPQERLAEWRAWACKMLETTNWGAMGSDAELRWRLNREKLAAVEVDVLKVAAKAFLLAWDRAMVGRGTRPLLGSFMEERVEALRRALGGVKTGEAVPDPSAGVRGGEDRRHGLPLRSTEWRDPEVVSRLPEEAQAIASSIAEVLEELERRSGVDRRGEIPPDSFEVLAEPLRVAWERWYGVMPETWSTEKLARESAKAIDALREERKVRAAEGVEPKWPNPPAEVPSAQSAPEESRRDPLEAFRDQFSVGEVVKFRGKLDRVLEHDGQIGLRLNNAGRITVNPGTLKKIANVETDRVPGPVGFPSIGEVGPLVAVFHWVLGSERFWDVPVREVTVTDGIGDEPGTLRFEADANIVDGPGGPCGGSGPNSWVWERIRLCGASVGSWSAHNVRLQGRDPAGQGATAYTFTFERAGR